MTNSNIIIIVVTATICSTLGVYVAIRKTFQYTRPPENTLVRSGDIELVDYIEPTRPQQIYNYPDLLEPQLLTYDRVPSYHTVDRWYIYSCLENSINLDYIWIFSLCFLILILFWKFRMKIYFIYLFIYLWLNKIKVYL
jgi:hypothetical protein